MDNTKKFSGKSSVYSAARPHYAEALFDMLADDFGFKGQPVADIGSGTGIFAEGLLSRGNIVYGVEPNDDMRAAAERSLAAYNNFRSVCGNAENSGLQDRSVYAVTAAQAFHWFDAEKFRAECARIMFGEYVVIAYNSRAEADLHSAVFAVNKKLCPTFKGFEGGITEERISNFFCGKYQRFIFQNDLVMDRDMFIKRCLSSSYAPCERDKNFESYVSSIGDIFDKFSADGRLGYPLISKAYIGKIIR